jgi:hypothetical protein
VATHDIARTNITTTPTAAIHSVSDAFGRQPTARPTPTTSPVVTRLRTTLATTCPTSTAPGTIGIVRNRLTNPFVKSVVTVTAVAAEPNEAHNRMMPGTT